MTLLRRNHGRTPGSRRALALLAIAAAWLAFAAAAQANPRGRFLGLIPPHRSLTAKVVAADAPAGVSFHGGSVMHANATHVIYWGPSGSFPHRYEQTIDDYFRNVATDSGTPSNVYATTLQYGDAAGPAAYASTFAGSIADTTPYPQDRCQMAARVCLTGDQVVRELEADIARLGLPHGMSDVYFVLTPPDVGVCEDSSSRSCSNRDFCAYHSDFLIGPDDQPDNPANEVIYVDAPFPTICQSGETPNGSIADGMVDSLSHEHIEAITDPVGDAWYDRAGDEIGDICDGDYGDPLGGAAGAQYNQLIGGGSYYLQQEWSNAAGRCVAPRPQERSTPVPALRPLGHAAGGSPITPALHLRTLRRGAVRRRSLRRLRLGATLVSAATVDVVLERCVRSGHGHRRCRTFARAAAGRMQAGHLRLRLLALLHRRSLPGGSYRVVIAAVSAGGVRGRASAAFRVRR